MRKKVSIIVYRYEEGHPKFLVARRPESKIWQYPTAKCEESEGYIDCAFREVREELGKVRILNFTDLHDSFEFESDRGKFVEQVVSIEIDDVERLQEEEFDQYEFLDLAEAKSRVEFETHKNYLEKVHSMLTKNKESKFFIIVAPTACGKSVIIKDLLEKFPQSFERVKTYMTRELKRAEDALLRVRVSKEEFLKMYENGELIEKNFHDGNWYGASYNLIEGAYKSGKHLLAEIDINGAVELKKHFSNLITIFITAPIDEIEYRVRERGGHTEEEIARRLEIAKKEISRKDECDFVVENMQGQYEETFAKIKGIIRQNMSL